ncbi:MAG: DM13 domain-containing protein [Pseudomonadota bacterium]
MIRAALLAALVALPASSGERSGEFVGGRTTGSVSIIQQDGQWFVRLGADFLHEGAPDPWVAFGKDGFRRDALLGPLREDEGEQLYPVPERLDPAEFNQVYIWCEQFSTSLGRAWLKP